MEHTPAKHLRLVWTVFEPRTEKNHRGLSLSRRFHGWDYRDTLFAQSSRARRAILLQPHPIMRFLAYVIGFLILIAGLAWAAIEAGAPTLYVQIGAVILLGIGIITGASRTRTYRPPPEVTVVRDNDTL